MPKLEDLKGVIDDENYDVMQLLSRSFITIEQTVNATTGKRLEFIYLGRLGGDSPVGQMFATMDAKTAEQALLSALFMVMGTQYPDANAYDAMESAVENWVDDQLEANAHTRH
ncbi:MAG: hypothetical protein U9Q19_05475 [Pseudomonadota bacterium]|nr:hypothetical protein [Pseudomonadota bacterium]